MNKLKFGELLLAFSTVSALGLSSSLSVEAEATANATLKDTASNYFLAQGEELSAGEQANADFQDKLSETELLNALQQGGYVIYFRHAQTEKDYADQVSADVNDCSTQRALSEEGWQQAQAIGAGFEAHSIPVGQVISSEYCRAWQTASIAFGRYEKNPALNFLPFEDYTEEQVAQMRDNVMPLLTAVPESGTNTVIVGHDDIFESATGIYPDPQGIAYVLQPDGNGSFELVANMLPEEWSQLASN
ncbi:MAG: histidine phosphatase family protein [Cyanophyceae cyanobacterium]